jgi:hypothetical protein
MAVVDLTADAVAPNAAGAVLTRMGGVPTAEGDIINPGDLYLIFNGSGASITATAASVATDSGIDIPDAVVTVAAGAYAVAKWSSRWALPADDPTYPGKVKVVLSATASVKRAVIGR